MKRCNPNDERISIVIDIDALGAILTMLVFIDNSEDLIKHGTVSFGL